MKSYRKDLFFNVPSRRAYIKTGNPHAKWYPKNHFGFPEYSRGKYKQNFKTPDASFPICPGCGSGPTASGAAFGRGYL